MTKNSMLLLPLIAACGVPASPTNVKMASVGLDPDEIGAAPQFNGGLIEYNLVDFSGAQLPLGLVGLVSYDQVGPDVTFKPPYKMVMGNAFIFQDDLVAPDSALGTLATPPSAIGTCQTRFEPRSYIGGLVDAGNKVTIRNHDGSAGWDIGRRPYVWPSDVSDVSAYYMEIDAWRAEGTTRPVRLDDSDDDPSNMVQVPHQLANFPEGERVEFDFPGGVPPLELNMGSIPVPLRASGADRSLILPSSPLGARLSWNGPRYDRHGQQVTDGHPEYEINMFAEEQEANAELEEPARTQSGYSSCLQYLPHNTMPSSVEDCLELQPAPTRPGDFTSLGLSFAEKNLNGQMYTSPSDTEDGQVLFEWVPGPSNTNDMLTLTVRFLGPVERDDDNMVEATVAGTPVPQGYEAGSGPAWADGVSETWEEAIADGLVPEGTPIPVPDRAALACDDDVTGSTHGGGKNVQWPMERQYTFEDDSFVPSLQGDPSHNLAEVTCRLDDQAGQFMLTEDILEKANDYAAMHGYEGIVFYLTRSTETEIQGPPVRDRFGKRHDTSPVKVVARSMQIGRFWKGD